MTAGHIVIEKRLDDRWRKKRFEYRGWKTADERNDIEGQEKKGGETVGRPLAKKSAMHSESGQKGVRYLRYLRYVSRYKVAYILYRRCVLYLI